MVWGWLGDVSLRNRSDLSQVHTGDKGLFNPSRLFRPKRVLFFRCFSIDIDHDP